MALTRKQQRDRRRYKRQTVGERMMITAVNGNMFNTLGQVYVRELGGYNDGSTIINSVPKAVTNKNAGLYIGEGRIVLVKEDYNNRLYIDGNDIDDLIAAGINLRQLNHLDPSTRYKTLSLITDLQTFPTGGDGTVKVLSGFYRKTTGEYANFSGEQSIDLLTTYKPATLDNQRIVALWINESTNAITVTQSSEFSQSTILKDTISTAMTYINSMVSSAPDNAVGIGTYILYGDDTEVGERNKFIDLRPFITAYSRVGSGSNVVVNSSTIPSGKDAFFAGGLTISGGLTVEGEMYIL